jgi:chromosome segregation ATPase
MLMDIKKAKEKVETAKLELARAEERLSAAKNAERDILQEIKDAGLDPENLDSEIQRLETELKAEEANVEEQLKKAEDIAAGRAEPESGECETAAGDEPGEDSAADSLDSLLETTA